MLDSHRQDELKFGKNQMKQVYSDPQRSKKILPSAHLQRLLKNLAAVDVSRNKQQKVICNVHTLLSDLKSCSMRKDLQWGKRIHAKVVESRHDSNIYVVTALIRMYARCGRMVEAHRIFDSIQNPDVVCWTTLLLGYADNGDGLVTLNLFLQMNACGCAPDCVTCLAAIKACTSLTGKIGCGECLKLGKRIHSEIVCDLDIFLRNTLIDMYAKCGSMVDARAVFDSIQNPNVVSWNVLLLGFAENGEGLVALELFSVMKARGYVPQSVTYVAILKACTTLAMNRDVSRKALEFGRDIHSEIGFHINLYVQNTLVDMYSKCGSMVDARNVFDSIRNPTVVSWTALLLGYAENGDGLITLELFSRMKVYGCAPDSMTYTAALKACTSLAGKRDGDGLKYGREIHSEIGQHLDHYVQNTLIDMYTKYGIMAEARRVFDSIQNPNVVSWNALLLGYVENSDGLTALGLFSRMKATCGCAPDSVTYVAALKACGLIGDLALGRKFHLDISEFTAHVVTCLVDFYSQCGSMAEACEVFKLHSTVRVVSTWNAMLAGYGSFGDSYSAFKLFKAMQDQGFQPNAITFVCVLSCCSHAGLVEKAKEYLEVMPIQYGITPTVMHYTCMIDVLGRANQLNEAIAVLQKMPCKPDAVTWLTLLGSCRKWKNFEIGRLAFESLADKYGSTNMWQETFVCHNSTKGELPSRSLFW